MNHQHHHEVVNLPLETAEELGFTRPIAPAGWTRTDVSMDGAQYLRTLTRQSVIISVSRELDGRRWVHLSTAHPSRLPRWDELDFVKRAFLGDDIKAVQVLPARREWVNIHPYCLHLFACLDDDPLPDFTRGSGSL